MKMWRVYDESGGLTEEARERFSADSWPLSPDRPSLRSLVVGLGGETGAGQRELARELGGEQVPPGEEQALKAKRTKLGEGEWASQPSVPPGIYASEEAEWEGGMLVAMYVEKAGLMPEMVERLERILLKVCDVFVLVLHDVLAPAHLERLHQSLYDAHYVEHLVSQGPKQRQDSVLPFPTDPRRRRVESTGKILFIVGDAGCEYNEVRGPGKVFHHLMVAQEEATAGWSFARRMVDVEDVFKATYAFNNIGTVTRRMKERMGKPSRLKVRVLQVLCDNSLPYRALFPYVPGLNDGDLLVKLKTPRSDVVCFLMKPEDKIRLLKQKLEIQEGHHPWLRHRFTLYGTQRMLDYERTLSDYNIQDGDTIGFYW